MRKNLPVMFAGLCLVTLLSATNLVGQVTPYQVGKATTLPVIDGTIDALWTNLAMYVAVDPTTWTPNPDHKSLGDCSFKWTALWDADSLYILVSVMDDIPTTGVITSGVSSWMNDNVELSIKSFDGDSAWFFRFGYDREPDVLGLLDSPPKKTPAGSRYATALQAGGWVVEAAIPWKALSSDPAAYTTWAAADKLLNVGVYVADLDDPTATDWDKLSGHVQWPKGWSATDIVLVNEAAKDNTAPETPAGFGVSDITFGGAKLSWTASPDTDVVGYLILKGTAPMTFTAETSVSLTLTAGKEYTFSVMAVEPQNLSAVSQPVTFTTLNPPTRKSQLIPKYAGSYPNPFEDLDKWETLPTYALEYGAATEPADLSSWFKAMWDNNNLYIQVSVKDQSIVNNAANSWDNDNAELFFDMGNERDGSSCEDVDGDLYKKDNFQHRFIAHQPALQTGSTPAPNWTNITQVYYDLYGSDGSTVVGWYVEATLPWATLNLTSGLTFAPAENKAIGFEIKIADADLDANNSGKIWSTYDNLPPHRNNSQYGELILGSVTASVDNLVLSKLSLYPNPATSQISLDIPDNGYKLTISDLTGRVLITRDAMNPGLQTVDISGLSSAVYLVTIENGKDCKRTLLVKE